MRILVIAESRKMENNCQKLLKKKAFLLDQVLPFPRLILMNYLHLEEKEKDISKDQRGLLQGNLMKTKTLEKY